MTVKKALAVFFGLLLLPICAEAAKSKMVKKEISITSKSKRAVELFKQARDLADNIRIAEAEKLYRQAIDLDPNFALAHASLGAIEPAPVGEQRIQKALSMAASLPETERMLIEALLADQQGDFARSLELRRQIVTLAPNDWHAHFTLGAQLVGQRQWEEAARMLRRATELNPSSGAAFNNLGYAYLAQLQNESAIDAFRKYVAARPQEPNPQDSLAEALMAAGRLEEAEQAFQEALRIEPSFYNAWQGIAQTRFLRGQWSEGAEALARAEAAASRPIDRLFIKTERAWVQFAQGDVDGAWRTLESAEKDAERDQLTNNWAFIPLIRATMFNQIDRPLDALREVALARERSEKASGGTQIFLTSFSLRAQLDAETKLGRVSEARQTLAQLKEHAARHKEVPAAQSNAHYGEGLIALIEGKARIAAEHFALCLPTDEDCGWKRLQAETMAGDLAAAEATRNRLLSSNERDASFLYVLAKVR